MPSVEKRSASQSARLDVVMVTSPLPERTSTACVTAPALRGRPDLSRAGGGSHSSMRAVAQADPAGGRRRRDGDEEGVDLRQHERYLVGHERDGTVAVWAAGASRSASAAVLRFVASAAATARVTRGAREPGTSR